MKTARMLTILVLSLMGLVRRKTMLAKKCLFMGIYTLLSVSLAIADPPAVHPATGEPLVIDCLRGTPDVIDGDLSDWKLEAIIPAVLDTQEQLCDDSSNKAAWDGPEDSSGKFYLLWDDENIYIAVVVKDDKISQNKAGGNIWNADCIEVFFTTTDAAVHSPDLHYQYGFNAKNQKWNWCNMESPVGAFAPDYLQIASSETDDGYIYEVSIAHGELLSLDFSAGNTIGFHPVLDDTDNGDRELQMTWTGFIAHDQSQGYGHLFLSDTEANPGPATGPSPANGSVHNDTWVTLSWRAGTFAASHDVYLGEDFDDVNDATRNSDVYRGNQTLTYYVAGFPGFAYPDGLALGTTYYWRIDEVNAPPDETVYKGNVWSFSIPPKTAYDPVPADGAELTETTVNLTWTPGFGAKLHTVYFGDDYDTVNNATVGVPRGTATYDPGPLEAEKVYYWRVDEFDGLSAYKGDVWAFTTPGAVGNPQPANGATDVSMATVLSWTAADNATSHEVYLGLDKNIMATADTTSSEYKGSKALGAESYDTGLLEANTTYYWRVDEIYAGKTVKGPVWTFTVGSHLLVDDFESYTDNDAEGEAIWQTWVDGLGIDDNGAQVGYLLPPYTEQKTVHGGLQSMPLLYVNEAGVTNSEGTLTLTAPRDWTAGGIADLSLWFRGDSENAAEPLYVAVSNSSGAPAIIANDDPEAAVKTAWKQWRIPLQAFADLGIDLGNVDKIAIGLGSKAGAATGGSGTMYIDDIRIYNRAISP